MRATGKGVRFSAEFVSPRVVTAWGILSGLSCGYLLVTNTTFIGGRVPEILLELLLLGVPAVGLTYTGYWLSSEGFDPADVRDIGMAAVGGALLATGLTSALLLSFTPDYVATNEAFFLLVGTGSEGALIGVLLGVLRATDLFFVSDQDTIDHMTTVNSVLRHNLRNRLTIMGSHLAFLRDDDDPGEEHIETIASQQEAILDLLADTKITADAARNGELDPVDLREVALQQADLIESAHESATVSVSVPEETSVWADDLLAPLLENLLFNAVAHTDAPTVDVEVGAETEGDTVVLTVADDGPGIPDGRKERVLSPDVGEGTGMGLYLVDTIASRYGGDLRIEDNDPRGTRVEVTLRRARNGG
jgi:signal transduction histidine kinase